MFEMWLLEGDREVVFLRLATLVVTSLTAVIGVLALAGIGPS